MKKSKTMKNPLQAVKPKASTTAVKSKSREEMSDSTTPKLIKRKKADIGSISASRISAEPSMLGGMSAVTIQNQAERGSSASKVKKPKRTSSKLPTPDESAMGMYMAQSSK